MRLNVFFQTTFTTRRLACGRTVQWSAVRGSPQRTRLMLRAFACVPHARDDVRRTIVNEVRRRLNYSIFVFFPPRPVKQCTRSFVSRSKRRGTTRQWCVPVHEYNVASYDFVHLDGECSVSLPARNKVPARSPRRRVQPDWIARLHKTMCMTVYVYIRIPHVRIRKRLK